MGRFRGPSGILKLCLCAALMLMGLAVHAEPRGELSYAVLPDGTARITGWSGGGDTLVIPGEIDGLAVSSVGSNAFKGNARLVRVEIRPGVEELCDGAFADCYSLKEISIPETLARVGENPFAGCENLRMMDVKDNAGCMVVNGVLFSDGGRRLVFCPRMLPMERYVAPEGTRAVDARAFSYCNRLLSVALPDSVTDIGADAFEGRANLTLLVGRDSCAEAYARQNDIKYTYPDADRWLADEPM